MTFDKAGVYAFSCAIHRGMSGAVIVGDVDGQATASLASSTSSGSDVGPLAPVAIGGLAGLAILGWGTALLQRRRLRTDPARVVPG